MSVYGVIPARLQSTRLPRKLLLAETGRPLIQYVWEAASRAKSLSAVLIATDSLEIADAVRGFGGRAEMTGEHPSGTDRIAEVVRRSLPDADMIVNVQGDEPELDPAHIDQLVELLRRHPSAQMATLATPMTSAEQVQSPSCVKVVCAQDGRALYFSRAPIPFSRDLPIAEVLETWKPGIFLNAGLLKHEQTPGIEEDAGRLQSPWLLHVGIYAYRREFLLELTQKPQSRLEQLEKLEQLRALEAGATIQVGVIDHPAVGIDTPDDYARFVRRQSSVVNEQ